MKKLLTIISTLILGISFLTGCTNNNIFQNGTNNTNENSSTQTIENETINLSDAFSFLNKSSDNYIKVRKEEGHVGVKPGMLNNVFYSDNNNDIKTILTMLNQKVKKADTQMMPSGGFYFEYRFYKYNEFYDEIRIINNLIIYNKTYYLLTKNYDFEFKNNANQIYNFVIYNDAGKVYKNNEYIKDFNNISEIEFVKIKATNKDIILIIESNGFELYVTSRHEFYKKDPVYENSYSYYKIVGELDFSYLI